MAFISNMFVGSIKTTEDSISTKYPTAWKDKDVKYVHRKQYRERKILKNCTQEIVWRKNLKKCTQEIAWREKY